MHMYLSDELTAEDSRKINLRRIHWWNGDREEGRATRPLHVLHGLDHACFRHMPMTVYPGLLCNIFPLQLVLSSAFSLVFGLIIAAM